MNHLDELSKPVAEVNSKYGDPEAFGERELKVLADIQEMPYETKFYSQEYVTALIAQLEAAQLELIKPLPIGELVHRLEGQTYEKWFSESDVKDLRERAQKTEAALSAANEKPKPISFDELAERVKFVTEGIRMEFDPQFYKGHQAVPFMNFNSLSRIVEMYRTALQTPVVRQQHADWSNATFGNVGPVGPLKHLSKEALETAASPGDLSEWADMQFLFWDAQRRAGITDAQIEQAMIDKLEINKSRVWPEPKDGEPREHIKAGFPVEGGENG